MHDNPPTLLMMVYMLQAINDARRLVKYHPEHVVPQLHALIWNVAPVVDDLRSFSAKTALTFLLVRPRSSRACRIYL